MSRAASACEEVPVGKKTIKACGQVFDHGERSRYGQRDFDNRDSRRVHRLRGKQREIA